MDQRDEMTRGVHEWRIAENEGAGELDPMTLMPREPRSISRMKARVRR